MCLNTAAIHLKKKNDLTKTHTKSKHDLISESQGSFKF